MVEGLLSVAQELARLSARSPNETPEFGCSGSIVPFSIDANLNEGK